MKLRSQRHTKTKKRAFIILAIALVVALTTYGAVAYTQSFWPFNTDSSQDDTVRPTNSVDYSPPTEEELANSQEGKKNSAEHEESASETSARSGNLAETPVAVAFASVVDKNVEVRAFAPQVIEGTGTCTATLTKGSAKVSESSKAFIDASSSQCQPIIIPVSKFSQSGGWTLTVSYVSDTHKGTSEKLEVTLP